MKIKRERAHSTKCTLQNYIYLVAILWYNIYQREKSVAAFANKTAHDMYDISVEIFMHDYIMNTSAY